MSKSYNRRARAKQRAQLAWLKRHRGLTEQPAGSNRDSRRDGIAAAQRRLGSWLVGLAWCGVWCAAGLRAAGVNLGSAPWRLAGVANIEDDAKAGRRPFRHWIEPHEALRYRSRHNGQGGLRGSLVVLYGRGVHVETVRYVMPRLGLVLTDGGNTSSGDAGSQSNGGGAFPRTRRLADVHGFAVIDYSAAK